MVQHRSGPIANQDAATIYELATSYDLVQYGVVDCASFATFTGSDLCAAAPDYCCATCSAQATSDCADLPEDEVYEAAASFDLVQYGVVDCATFASFSGSDLCAAAGEMYCKASCGMCTAGPPSPPGPPGRRTMRRSPRARTRRRIGSS